MTGVAGAHITRTLTQLADGRDLFYFDDTERSAAGGSRRDQVDERQLEAVAHETLMRLDPLTGDWIAMASHRMTRTHLPPADLCPLCSAGTGREQGEIPAGSYDVVVFENRFPSFAGSPGAISVLEGEPLWPVAPAAGRCEVVCFTSDHSSTFAALPVSRARTVVEAWCDRTAELSALPGVEQVFVFENRGEEIGVTLHHPHGQIYAYPFVTPRTEALLRRAEAHRNRTGRNLLRDVLDAERRAGTRVVLSSEHWTAYVPAAARWPVEVHLAPHRDVPDLAALSEAERDDLAAIYLRLLQGLDRFFPEVQGLPYIAGWHQAPVGDRRDLARLHLQVFSVMRAPGKLKYLAGSESGMGAWINDTTPEAIAERLRGAIAALPHEEVP
jgi:UDPglucose--hexose-1-phosphate uridylyltransferase